MAESPVGEEVAGAQCPGCPTSTTWSPAREEMLERGEVQSTEMGSPCLPLTHSQVEVSAHLYPLFQFRCPHVS